MTNAEEFSSEEMAAALDLLQGGEEAEPAEVQPDLVTPPGLSPAAAEMWLDIASTYTLRPDEWAVLHLAAKTLTTLNATEAKWADEGFPLVGEGYNGQPVEHPLVTLQNKLQSLLAAHLRQLRLPDDDGISPFSHAGRGKAGGKAKAANGSGYNPNARRNLRGKNRAGDRKVN